MTGLDSDSRLAGVGVTHVHPVGERAERRDPVPQRHHLAVEQEVVSDPSRAAASPCSSGKEMVTSFSFRE